ncbi:MAG: tetraacyldisaccharide 4'-kinase [Ginsengibacter sp.]
MRKKTRYILLPFSFLYEGIIKVRNQLFDKKVFRSATFDVPLICVGNLTLGGTGKTPMVEYLVRMLQQKYHVATLSRGYKRKTKGFFIAIEYSKTTDIGDEPMQIYKKFPNITVAVDEERVMGIPKILNDKPETEVIILDDAFQHRQVAAGLNILLTEYNHLYTKDFLLPAGNLRDTKASSKRADIIIVTKCKSNLNEDEKKDLIEELNPLSEQTIYFTKIKYETPFHLFTKEKYNLQPETQVLLVCGIANPKKLQEEIKPRVSSLTTIRFSDHHVYNSIDLKKITNEFSKIEVGQKIILTTEKDAVRLSTFENELRDLPFFVLPMAHQFLFGEEMEFEKSVLEYIEMVGQ